MKIAEIHRCIDWSFPFMTAEDFDNVGLLIGSMEQEVSRAVVALDCTKETVAFAKKQGAQLIITHHPVIFDPIKRIDADSVVYECIKSGIAVLSAHTNLDTGKNGVNDTLCDILGIKDKCGLYIDGYLIRTGTLDKPHTAKELALLCKERLSANVRYTDGKKEITRVAVCSGSGGSMLGDVMKTDVDAYITADVKHSQFIAAANNGFTLLDCGHFETEDIIVSPLCKMLSEQLSDVTFTEYHGGEILKA